MEHYVIVSVLVIMLFLVIGVGVSTPVRTAQYQASDLEKKFEKLPHSLVQNPSKSQGNNVISCHFTNWRSGESFRNVDGKHSGRFCILGCLSSKSSQDDVEGRSFYLCMNLETPTIEGLLTSASDPMCLLNKSEEQLVRVVIDCVENNAGDLVDCAILLMSHPDSCFVCQMKNMSIVGELALFPVEFNKCLLFSQCARSACFNIQRHLLKNISSLHKQNVPFKDIRRERSFRFRRHHKPFLIKKEKDLGNKTNEVSILGKRGDPANISNEGNAMFPMRRVRKEASKPWFSDFNATAFQLLMEQRELKRRLRRESEWAYLCVVFILLLILFSIWIMRGFHSRTAKKREIRHDDNHHYLTVKEILYRRARYLPMFNRNEDFEEVFVHDCGTNP